MTALPHLMSWTLHDVPVLTDPVVPGVWTLDDLARRDRTGLLLGLTARRAPRVEALLALHRAVEVVVDVVAAPLVVDSVELTTTPHDVGLVLDDRLGVAAFWAGRVSVTSGAPDVERLGRTVGALLAPVVLGAGDGLPVEEADELVDQALTDRLRRLATTVHGTGEVPWVDQLLAAAAHERASHVAERSAA